MKKMQMVFRFGCIALLALWITGCATKVVDTQRYFWPMVPDVPRIEWLGAYSTESDIKEANWLDAIAGKEDEAGLGQPLFVTADGMGKIYVTDLRVRGVVMMDLVNKEFKVVGGEEASGYFLRITGVALDGEGNVYAADGNSRKIIVFSKEQQVKSVLDLSQHVKNIASFAIDRSRKRIIVPDSWGHQIVTFGLDGSFIAKTGKRGEGDGEFNYPSSVAIDPDGNLVVCDAMNARIQRLTPDLKFISKFGRRGDGVGEFNIIKAVAVDSEGHIYVTDSKSHRVAIFNAGGEILLSIGGPFSARPGSSITPGGFLLPQGIYIDQNDSIYVVDQFNARVQKFQYLTEKYLKEHPIDPSTVAK